MWFDWKEGIVKLLIAVGVIAVVLIFSVVVLFGIDAFGLADKYIWKTGNAKIDHEVYKHSSGHIEDKISTLADQKKDFDKATDNATKTIIVNYLKEELDNFDLSQIDNIALRRFAEDIFNGRYDNLED